MIKDRRATAPLLALLQDKDSSPWLVWQLVRALGGIGDPAVTQALLAIARAEASDPAFGKSARLDAIRSLFAVAAAGDAATAKAIIGLFQEIPDDTFKKEALHNLAKLASNKDVLKELNTVLDTNEEFAYKNLALLGMAHAGGPESVDKILETIRANEKFDSDDVVTKLGRQLGTITDPDEKEAMREKLAGAIANESDPRVLASLVEKLGPTGDPALADAILARAEKSEDGGFREKANYALAYSRPDKALPTLEQTVLDAERDGQERYGAIEALSYWDSPAAIATLERLRDSFTADDQQVYRSAVEGALNKVIQKYEAKKKSEK
jgi:HEAT repeat protein